jgi:hypothetical protein
VFITEHARMIGVLENDYYGVNEKGEGVLGSGHAREG